MVVSAGLVSLLGFGGMNSAHSAESPGAIPRFEAPGIHSLPMIFQTYEYEILVEAVATGLSHPWGMVFLPNGDMLVTEREGRVRLISNGILQRDPVAGTPEVYVRQLSGLMDIALHPGFATNCWP